VSEREELALAVNDSIAVQEVDLETEWASDKDRELVASVEVEFESVISFVNEAETEPVTEPENKFDCDDVRESLASVDAEAVEDNSSLLETV